MMTDIKNFAYSQVPKCVKIIRNYTTKINTVYSNVTHEIDSNNKGSLPSTLFLQYGYEVRNLLRVYFDIGNEETEFGMCSV